MSHSEIILHWQGRNDPNTVHPLLFSHSEVSVPAAGSTCPVLHSTAVSVAGEPAALGVGVFNVCVVHTENVTKHDKHLTDSWTLLSCASIYIFFIKEHIKDGTRQNYSTMQQLQ